MSKDHDQSNVAAQKPVKIYERNINSAVHRIGPKHLLVSASLLDLNHSMRVEIRVNMESDEIEDAVAEITKAPLGICQEPITRVKAIIGLKIARGINKDLVRTLGGPLGCTHLYELALHAVRLAFNMKLGMKFNWEEWISRSVSEKDFVKMAMPHLRNSCRPFKEE